MNVTGFPNGQLGGDPQMLSQLRAGGIDLLAAPSLTLSTLVPLSGLPSIGFAFGSYDQVWAALDGGVKERADLLAMDRQLQAELTAKGMTFNTPDPVRFRAALVKAGFYAQWQKTYGAEAWAKLEQYTGPLT